MKQTQPKTTAEDSLKKRYFYKLFTNLISFVITLITATIIPRTLGPTAYGNFNFLSTFFSQVVGFFDAGTSVAFYTKLSQRTQDVGLTRFYWGVTALISFGTILLVSLTFLFDLQAWLWPNQTSRYIWMAVIWGLLTWYSQIINKILDAYGLTVRSEISRIQQRVLGLALILAMFWLNRFSLTEFFIYHYLILLFVCFAWGRILHQAGIELLPQARLTFEQTKAYGQEFYEYTSPLIVYAFVGLIVGGLDNWFLQKFAGSVQHGFYGLSYRIGGICFLFTSAMTPLLLREFSKAYSDQNINQMGFLFQRYIPLLYTIAAFFAVFLAVEAEKVSVIFGGNQFEGAELAISIMAFYPVHQTYGQLSGSVFYATGQTKLYRNLGITIQLTSLPLTWWLIAPEHWWGLNLGAVGLAIKMVLVQVIGVNLQLWFNARLLKLSFGKLLAQQLYSVMGLGVVAWGSKLFIDQTIPNVLLSFLASGFIYTLGSAILTLLMPALLLMSRFELLRQINHMKTLILGRIR